MHSFSGRVENTLHKYEKTWHAKYRKISTGQRHRELTGRWKNQVPDRQDSYVVHLGTTIPDWSRRTDGENWMETHFIELKV